jgi:hypothetical protein
MKPEQIGRVAVGLSTWLGIIIIVLSAVPLIVGSATEDLTPLGLDTDFLADIIKWTTVALIASRGLQAVFDKIAQAFGGAPVVIGPIQPDEGDAASGVGPDGEPLTPVEPLPDATTVTPPPPAPPPAP